MRPVIPELLLRHLSRPVSPAVPEIVAAERRHTVEAGILAAVAHVYTGVVLIILAVGQGGPVDLNRGSERM